LSPARAGIVILMAVSALQSVEAAEGGNDSTHAYHSDFVGVFTGFTGEVRRDRSFTLGLEYAHRFTKSFSLGAMAEHVNADHDFWVFAVPFGWHQGHWKYYAAPGIEHESGHGDHGLLRVGVEYAFELEQYEIAPQVAIDFVDGDTVLVMGVTFGFGL